MPHARLCTALLVCLLALWLTGFAPPAQSPALTLSVNAGFDGRFRDGEWMPVVVRVRNDGPDLTGRLVVRPETSGSAITSTYSAPVSLPAGARQTVVLYITARSFATQVRVELIDESGAVVAAEPATVRAVQPLDRLFVVVSQSPVGTIDLTSAQPGGYDSFQASWPIENLPDRAAALAAVDVMLFSDVDTSTLSSAQRTAIIDWVAGGGHLLVAGGAPWQPTAAGLSDLLPLRPESSQTVSDLGPLAAWVGLDDALAAQTVLATGATRPDSRILVSAGGEPLVVRREVGEGVVDYLTFDPNAAPLRGWGGLTDVWMALLTTTGARPGWTYGFTDWELAAGAVEILPGFNPLPDVLPLCGFLGVYILLIGPVNYLILARLNRREWAWVTIPLFIVLFSALAWALGFNLRGTEATLSRLSVVRAWPDVEQARVETLVGLLSPRRSQYTLTMGDSSTLRPVPRVLQSSILGTTAQTSVDIRQTERFEANQFSVDASFIAGFNATGVIDRPQISGSASLTFDGSAGQQIVIGSVRNDTDQTLEDPVILARGVAHHFDTPLEPGEQLTFELALAGEGLPAPGNYAPALNQSGLSLYYYGYGTPGGQSIVDILGTATFNTLAPEGEAQEEDRRRRLFLGAFVNDYFVYNSSGVSTLSTGRGNRVYLAGWTQQAPLPVELAGANWRAADSTLYLVELDVRPQFPASPVTISADQFTWTVDEKTGIGDYTPFDLSLQPGEEVVFRFTPLPAAALPQIDRLTINMARSSTGIVPLQLYNWESGAWDEVELRSNTYTTARPAPYLGPENSVRIRLVSDLVGGYLRVEQLTVEARGRYTTTS